LAPRCRDHDFGLPVIAFSMARAAALSSRLNRCPYVLRVTMGFLCPMRRLTSTTFRPSAIRAEAWVWRRAWKLTRGRPKLTQASCQRRVRRFGGYRWPSPRPRSRRAGAPPACR